MDGRLINMPIYGTRGLLRGLNDAPLDSRAIAYVEYAPQNSRRQLTPVFTNLPFPAVGNHSSDQKLRDFRPPYLTKSIIIREYLNLGKI